MSKLLRADLRRLFHSKVFWLCNIFLFAFSLYIVIDQAYELKALNMPAYTDDCVGACGFFGVFALAVLCPALIGTEYSDGTIRNKLICGHSRVSVYLANFLTTVIAGVIILALWVSSYLLLGVTIHECKASASVLAATVLGCVLELAAFAAIFTFMTMTISNKVVNASLCIVLVLVLVFAAIFVAVSLQAPETVSGYETNESGEVTAAYDDPNPRYIAPDSGKRSVFEAVHMINPGNQALELAGIALPEYVMHMCVYDVCLIAVFCFAGCLIFRKRDVR